MTGRFAPTPSGRMHLGNIFSALLAWLSVRSQGGELLLRIEDLDTMRCTVENADIHKDDLRWLGLTWDRETAPQRDRSERYEEILHRLLAEGQVFPCWCTRGDLKNAPNAPHASDGHPIYPGTCRDLSEAERAAKAAKKPPLYRLRVPDEYIPFTDGNYGPQGENLAKDCGDFILRRSDGLFGYQLAVVVDDALSGVNEVVRGRDILTATPRQIYLLEKLEYPTPSYIHIPLLMDADGRRLAKRDKDLDLTALSRRFTAEELLGKLAFSAGILPEERPASMDELIRLFDWQNVRREDMLLPRSLTKDI